MIIDEKVTENSKTTFLKSSPFQTNYVIEKLKHRIDDYSVRAINTERWYNPKTLVEHKNIKSDVDAEKIYQNLIEDYVQLMKSQEILKPKPEEIFKDSINYHVEDHDRCLNCKFNIQNARGCPHHHTHRYDDKHNPIHPLIHNVLCTNQNNLKDIHNIEEDYNRILDANRYNRYQCYDCDETDDMNLYYSEAYIKRSHGVFPEVDPNGICDNYERFE